MPGIAASTSDTWLFGSPPNAVEAPENSLALEVTWACTSRPITTSQSPVEPLINFPGLLCTFMVRSVTCPSRLLPARSRPWTSPPGGCLHAVMPVVCGPQKDCWDGNAHDQPQDHPKVFHQARRRVRARRGLPCPRSRPNTEPDAELAAALRQARRAVH